jgi:hypothetical protein
MSVYEKKIAGTDFSPSVLIDIFGNKEWGASLWLLDLAKTIKLDRLILPRQTRWRDQAIAHIIIDLISNRNPFMPERTSCDTFLWDHFKLPQTKDKREKYLSYAIEKLLSRKKSIQNQLIKKTLKNESFINCHFIDYQGEEVLDEFGEFQIVLFSQQSGCPVAVEIFPKGAKKFVEQWLDQNLNELQISSFTVLYHDKTGPCIDSIPKKGVDLLKIQAALINRDIQLFFKNTLLHHVFPRMLSLYLRWQAIETIKKISGKEASKNEIFDEIVEMLKSFQQSSFQSPLESNLISLKTL